MSAIGGDELTGADDAFLGEGERFLRSTAATREQLSVAVELIIDNQPVRVNRARPNVSERGVVQRDARCEVVPRPTTIWEAVTRRYDPYPNPIPTLCHQSHLTPVGVCRICTVLVGTRDERGKDRGWQTVPSCCTPLPPADKGTTVVHTRCSDQTVTMRDGATPVAGEYIDSLTRVLVQMLCAFHVHDEQPQAGRYHNELHHLAGMLGATVPPEFLRRGKEDYPVDHSSSVVRYDPNNCIQCTRCIRSCSEVRPFQVIGLTGKGGRTLISFDLHQPMGQSSCVACGECMVACPTGALTFNNPVHAMRPDGCVSAAEASRDPLFAGVPLAFLHWNEGGVVQKRYEAGEVLCHEGEYGTLAFVLLEGQVEVWQHPAGARRQAGHGVFRITRPAPGEPLLHGRAIFGEMALVNNDRRTATLRAAAGGCTVWEINRNVFHILLRDPVVRRWLDARYVERALQSLRGNLAGFTRGKAAAPREERRWLFSGLDAVQSDWCVTQLSGRMSIVRAGPGDVLIRENETIWDGKEVAGTLTASFYILLSGFVQVSQQRVGRDRTIDCMRPGEHFGEIALLSLHSDQLALQLPGGMSQRGLRTTSCIALGSVELARVPGREFSEVIALARQSDDSRIREIPDIFFRQAGDLLDRNRRDHARRRGADRIHLDDYIDQGLHQGQSLLMIDLARCTRCDECTRACVESHPDGLQFGVTRMERKGPVFADRYLVVTSCRSCHQPSCLPGCPVDAIHRQGPHLQIQIDDHCIGCNLCAVNCPYDNIKLHTARDSEGRLKTKATTCDLCGGSAGPGPRCVSACPHEAIFRGGGPDLLRRVGG